jgi:serine acetyltransferase
MDWNNIQIRRLKDRASPSRKCVSDRVRLLLIARMRGLTLGRSVVFKRGVEVSICQGGTLAIGDNAFFHSNVWILLTKPQPKVRIGGWVHIGRDTIIAAKNRIEIGDYTVIAPRCYFVDHEHGFASSDVILNQQSVLKEIHVGRDCYFGANTVVTAGVRIGDGAIIGAGSVVTRDIPEYEVWAGSPARFVKKRI